MHYYNFWRHTPHEVDFVLKHERRLIGVEVKSGQGRATGGLKTFAKEFSPERTLLVGEAGIPLDEFLSAPAAHWFETSS